MAGGAVFRRGLIEKNRLRADHLRQLVTVCAAHILMRPAQRERRPLLMIEQRRLPFHAVVALDTAGNVGLRKLLSVDIFVAILALGRSSLEIDVDEASLKIGRLVAVAAGGRAMRSQQRKLRFRVIEPR